MFCSKCGKTIDDNATFCAFCGAAVEQNANTVTNGAPQGVSQQSAPQYGAPQNNVPQYGAPQNGTNPYQMSSGGFSLNLDPKIVNIVNKALRGSLILLSVLTIIGAIGSMGSVGSLLSGNLLGAMGMEGFYNLSRVPAIIAFSLSVLGAVFTFLTKQKSLFSYISAGAGLILFIFNFVMYGGYVSLATNIFSGKTSMGGIVVSGIFLIIGALAMIACSVIILLNKEDIIKFKPKF